jgi:amidase
MDDGIVAPTPPVQRALRETKEALEKAGHEVIEWKAYVAFHPLRVPDNCRYDPAGGVSLLERFFVGDGGVKIASTIAQSGETWVQGLEAYSEAYEASKHVPRTVGDLWSLQAERTGYVKRALDAWMATAGLTSSGKPFDAVISPATAYAACPQ